MARASYKKAIEWIAANDDTEFMRHPAHHASGTPSATASLVMDLWDKDESQFRRDLLKELQHIYPNSWHGVEA